MTLPPIEVKRIYEAPTSDDGARVLVDRIWPRGIANANARLDCWEKQLAPSTALRQWFAHDPAKWQQFRHDYAAELEAAGESTAQAITNLLKLAHNRRLTLLYAARDSQHNNAVALKDYIKRTFR